MSARTATAATDTVADEPGGGVWDLLVIGGGSAGLVGARTAASFGASVLLVERDRPGGDCLWTGCVPSKALLAAAGAAAQARRASRLGVHVEGVRIAFDEVMAHVRDAIATIEPADSAQALRAAGVAYTAGSAHFTGPDTATVAGTTVRFRHALVATGSDPVVPAIPGLHEHPRCSRVLDSDTVWGLTRLPDRLAVLGGGTVGCELGQAFTRLGSRVTIVEAANRLLPGEDEEASRLLTGALEGDGATVLTGSPVTAVEHGADHVRVVLDGEAAVAADAVLVAVGRRPDSRGLGLDTAGVATDERGFVAVDAHLRTGNARVWAAGDVTGHPQFTHVAGVHGSTAATNAVLGLRRRADLLVPRVTFTSPEVAAVGATTGHRVRTYRSTWVDRAVAEDETTGFSRLVLDRRGRVIGATVVGPRAGETLAELTLAVRRGLRTRDLAATMHPYPTFGDGPWNAAIADVRTRLGAGATRMVVRALATARRRRADRHRR